jgi:hypothetical protein
MTGFPELFTLGNEQVGILSPAHPALQKAVPISIMTH